MSTGRYHRTMQDAFGPYTSRELEPMPEPPRALIRPVLGYLLALLAGVVAFFYFKG